MKRHHVFFFVLLLQISCTFFRAPGRDDCDKILGREQMVAILADIYLLEAFLMEYQHVDRKVRDSSGYYYGGIFDRHGVDARDFEEALDCYLLDAREMERIHEDLLQRLSIMESEAETSGRER